MSNEDKKNQDNEKEDQKVEGLFGDVMKKVFSIGVGAAFMTEDVVKKYVNELPISRDMAMGLLKNAKGIKEDFLTSVQEEVRRHISKVDPKKLVEEVVSKYDMEVNATIKFKRKEDAPNPLDEEPEKSDSSDD